MPAEASVISERRLSLRDRGLARPCPHARWRKQGSDIDERFILWQRLPQRTHLKDFC